MSHIEDTPFTIEQPHNTNKHKLLYGYMKNPWDPPDGYGFLVGMGGGQLKNTQGLPMLFTSGGSGTAGIGGGLDQLRYCQTFVADFVERSVLSGIIAQITGQNTRRCSSRSAASRRGGRREGRRVVPISELYIIMIASVKVTRLTSD
jgi:hypothetical protein